jgi:hypothetical protein
VTTVAVTDCPANGVLVPRGVLGRSIEWSKVPHWFGTTRAGAQQLIDSVRPA